MCDCRKSKVTVKIPATSDLKKDAPGIILGIWQGNRELKVESVGISNIMTQKEMKKTNHMRIGSITKTFTSTVILNLAGKNIIDIEQTAYHYFSKDPTNEILTWLKYLPKNITITQLGNMTSG